MVIPNRQSEHRKSEICSRYPYQLHSANNKYFTQATRIPHQNPSQPRIEGLDWQSSVNRNWTLRMTVTVPLTAWTKNVRNMVAGRATIITDIPFWQLCSGARPKWKSRRKKKKPKQYRNVHIASLHLGSSCSGPIHCMGPWTEPARVTHTTGYLANGHGTVYGKLKRNRDAYPFFKTQKNTKTMQASNIYYAYVHVCQM